MKNLPVGWDLADITQLIASDGLFSDGDWVESKDQDPNGTIRLLQLADIGDGFFINKSNRFINDEQFNRLRCTEVFEGDVLIARMPDPLGRACIVRPLKQRSVTVVDIAIARPGQFSVNANWLKHFLNAPSTRSEIELQSSGTTRRRIARGKLAQIKLPIPPSNEQKRIADKLDGLLARVDACRERLDRIPAILKRFRQAVLAAATSGKLMEEWKIEYNLTNEWPKMRIKDVTIKVGSGSTPRGGEAAYKTEGIPLIRSMNVIFYGFKFDGLAFLDSTQAHDLRNVEVRAQDVLLNITGASIGRVTLAPAELDGARVNQHVCIIRPKDALLPEFLCWFLAAPEMQNHIGGENYGVTRQALTKQQILDFEVPVPSMDEQIKIVQRVEALFAYADRLEARYAAARAQVEKLTPALLAKAFRGELVPQDPNDEPASVLLERIRAAAHAPTKKRNSSKAVNTATGS